MSTALSRQLIVRFGKAANTTDYATVPSLIDLVPERPEFAWPEREKLDRDPQRDDGSFASPILGALAAEDLDFTVPLILRGIAGNDGGAIDAETDTDAGLMLDVLLGDGAAAPSGAGEAATGGNGATPNVTFASGAGFANGRGILIPLDDGTFVPREIVSGGGTGTVVVDRDFSGTVDTEIVPRSEYWTVDPSVHMHKHGHFRFEVEGLARQDFHGCMGKATLEIAARRYLTLNTAWKATNSIPAAAANPTVSPLTVGDAIVNTNSLLYFGDQSYQFANVAIDLGGEVMERQADSGPQGRNGFTVQNKRPTLSFTMYAGTSTAAGELTRAGSTVDWDDIGGEASAAGAAAVTVDLALQFGARAGSCCYIRVPAFVVTKRKRTSYMGLEAFAVEGFASRPASGNPLRLHLF